MSWQNYKLFIALAMNLHHNNFTLDIPPENHHSYPYDQRVLVLPRPGTAGDSLSALIGVYGYCKQCDSV